MSAPWAPPEREERPRRIVFLQARHGQARRFYALQERLAAAEAELERLERQAADRRRAWWLAFIAGLALALVLL